MTGYPAGVGAIFYSEVTCSGEEENVLDCHLGKSLSTTGAINCDREEDVQLACLPPQEPQGRGKRYFVCG